MTIFWRRPSRGSVAAGLVIVAGLTVAGCHGAKDPAASGSSSSPAASSSGSASPSASATSSSHSSATAPLTGLPASTSAAARPAVALDLAGPDLQGLTSADLVFQMATTPVRYIAVYQSRMSVTAGPVTTTEPADRLVLAVLHPLLGYDGAALPYFVKLLDNPKGKVTDAGYARYPSSYTATSLGVNTSPEAILKAVSGDTAPPPLFQYRGAASGDSTLASTGEWKPSSVQVTIPGEGIEQWSFSTHSGRWTLTSGGPRVQVANLVVERVPYRQISVNRRHGITVANAEVAGSGRTEVFSGSASGGTAASGTWSKPHTGSVTNYFDSGGSLMAFQPGPTWVILAPPGTVSTSK